MKTIHDLKHDLKALAQEIKSVKEQRKTVNLKVERTMPPYRANWTLIPLRAKFRLIQK